MTEQEQQHNEQASVTPSSDETENTEQGNKSIPYDRFKQVNDQRKALQDKLDALQQAEQERTQAKLAQEGKYQELIESLKPEAERAKTLEAQIKLYQERDRQELENELLALDDTVKNLVPKGDPSEQLEWVRSAKRAGLFEKSKPPVTESGVTGDRKDPEPKLSDAQQRFRDLAKRGNYLKK